eukprot:285902-Pelagomonas_calceolata.AAC.2
MNDIIKLNDAANHIGPMQSVEESFQEYFHISNAKFIVCKRKRDCEISPEASLKAVCTIRRKAPSLASQPGRQQVLISQY